MHSELREAGKDILSIAALSVRMKRNRALPRTAPNTVPVV